MKYYCLSVWALLLFIEASFSQTKGQIDPSKVPIPQWHYLPEYTFDEPVDSVSWAKQKPGLHVAYGSTDQLYLRSEVPSVNEKSISWEEIGWKGERLNTQILVWSADTTEQIRFKASDLKTANGKIIRNKNIKLNLVRYVVSNLPYGATDFDCGPFMDSGWLLPDRFETFERFDLPGKTVRPVWVAFNIPQNTEPGDYMGSIEIQTKEYSAKLNVKIKVQNQVLPRPYEWSFKLDLWQNPWVLARYYNLEPWSNVHKELLREHLKLYAEAGGKHITTYTVHSPWHDDSYMIEETMIEWIKSKNNSWKFDYSIFDQYVELAMEVGIDKAITIYTPIPWLDRFRYLDEESGDYIYTNWSPTSEEYKIFWNIFLKDLKAHLEKKGWFKKTYLGINENPLENTIASAKLIKAHSKNWKITYAGSWHPELSGLVDDYSPILGSEPTRSEIQNRLKKGFTTTYYVCCGPPRPNNFVFSAPVEGKYQGWYAAACNYDGFLRWAYDAWPMDPMRDARHTKFPAGDCFLVYPGANSSIRFEKLREGIIDFEKIRIIRELASKSNDKKTIGLIKELENHLNTFHEGRNTQTQDYNRENLKETVRKGRRILEDLSDILAH